MRNRAVFPFSFFLFFFPQKQIINKTAETPIKRVYDLRKKFKKKKRKKKETDYVRRKKL